MGETVELARFSRELPGESVPEPVRRRAALLLLDQIGCQIAGVQLPWSQRIYQTIRPLSATGRATVVGHPDRLCPDAAAFLNSAFGHSNESDDTHLKSPTHPGAVIIPAAVALAEEQGVPGRQLLDAIIVGYEVMLRVSYAVSPHLITRGHHPPPAVGTFGAAATAARLLGLDQDQTVHALAIAGSHSAGLLEYTQTGGSVKRLHCAIPAQAGVRSALLAQQGVTGPPTVLEGKRGFTHVFSPERDLGWLTRGLGSQWLLMETAIKSYSCCYLIHPALDAIGQLRAGHPFTAEDVIGIDVHTTSAALVHHVGVITEPQDILGAQFSMGFALSLLLHRGGCGFWDFFRADLTDPQLLDLSRRVRVVLDEDDRSGFRTGLRLRVSLRDGTVLTGAVAHARGEPEQPMSDDEIRDKFLGIAGPVLGPDAKTVCERIEAIGTEPDPATVLRLVAR
jgi:2-methylcitrate dehydratase PrpD